MKTDKELAFEKFEAALEKQSYLHDQALLDNMKNAAKQAKEFKDQKEAEWVALQEADALHKSHMDGFRSQWAAGLAAREAAFNAQWAQELAVRIADMQARWDSEQSERLAFFEEAYAKVKVSL